MTGKNNKGKEKKEKGFQFEKLVLTLLIRTCLLDRAVN